MNTLKKKSILLVAILSLSIVLYSQGIPLLSSNEHFTASPPIRVAEFNHPPFGQNNDDDSLLLLLDYYIADSILYHPYYFHQFYLYNQAQLMNWYYTYPSDTAGSNALTWFDQNYDCINYISVAFDSLYDPFTGNSINHFSVTSIYIDTLYFPIVQVNHSGIRDTLDVQLNLVDDRGFPESGYILDTMIIGSGDTIGAGNDYTASLHKIPFNYNLNANRFAITLTYYGQKNDSCWFLYGCGYLNDTCRKNSLPNFALPTHFSTIPTTQKPIMANSFTLWNQYSGIGILPTENSNNIFYPCDTADKTYQEGRDGANFFQNIDMAVSAKSYFPMGINKLIKDISKVSNNPNPFSKSTTITYALDKISDVIFTITDVSGRKITHTDLGRIPAGVHNITYDGTRLTTGVYFYTFDVNGITQTNKMMIIK